MVIGKAILFRSMFQSVFWWVFRIGFWYVLGLIWCLEMIAISRELQLFSTLEHLKPHTEKTNTGSIVSITWLNHNWRYRRIHIFIPFQSTCKLSVVIGLRILLKSRVRLINAPDTPNAVVKLKTVNLYFQLNKVNFVKIMFTHFSISSQMVLLQCLHSMTFDPIST